MLLRICACNTELVLVNGNMCLYDIWLVWQKRPHSGSKRMLKYFHCIFSSTNFLCFSFWANREKKSQGRGACATAACVWDWTVTDDIEEWRVWPHTHYVWHLSKCYNEKMKTKCVHCRRPFTTRLYLIYPTGHAGAPKSRRQQKRNHAPKSSANSCHESQWQIYGMYLKRAPEQIPPKQWKTELAREENNSNQQGAGWLPPNPI